MFGVFGELGVLGKQCTSSKAVMLYTLTMTSDVNFFNATVRGLENEELVVQARRRHGLKTMDGVMPVVRKPSEAEQEAVRGRLMSALGTVLEEHCVQTWLGAELGAAIAALKSSGASLWWQHYGGGYRILLRIIHKTQQPRCPCHTRQTVSAHVCICSLQV